MQIQIEAVHVNGRYRKDLGDLTTLAASIKAVGLINPITVTTDGQLIAGERRLAACRSLGWSTIAAVTVDALDDAVAKLKAERDENTERKEMTISERVALGRALEELEKPKAARRRHDAAVRAGKIRQGTLDPASVSNETQAGRVADIAGRAVDLAPTAYFKAGKVVEIANDSLLPLEVQQTAKAALDEMDITGNISGAYEKVRGISPALKAPVKAAITAAAPQRKAVNAALSNLSGISYGLSQITELHPDITSEEAAQWVGGLSEARRALEVLIKRCKERINNA